MNWTEETEATKEIPYSHVKCQTPIGRVIITWKNWKENPSYDVELNNDWIGNSFDLDSAKSLAKNHVIDVAKKLNRFINGGDKIC